MIPFKFLPALNRKRGVSLNLFFLTWMIIPLALTHAQKPDYQGYIVKLNGDTTFGKVFMVERYANSQKIDFQEEGSEAIVRYLPHQIKAYGNIGLSRYESFFTVVNHSSFRVKQLTYDAVYDMKNDSIFLQLLVKGKMSLYYFKDGEDQNHFFIQKEGEPIEELINYRYLLEKREGSKVHQYIIEPEYYKTQLAKMTADCGPIKADFEGKRYKNLPWKIEDMQALVVRYNGLMEGRSEYQFIGSYRERESRFRWGLVGGLTPTKIQFEADANTPVAFQNADFGVGPGLGLGVFVTAANEDRSKPWSFYGELFLMAFGSTSQVESFINPDLYYNYNMYLSFSYTRLSEILHYRVINKPQLQLYALGGLSQSVFGLSTNTLEIVRYINGTESSTSREIVAKKDLTPIELGLQGGLGFSYKSFMLEMRYEYGMGFLNVSDVQTSRGTFQGLIGFYLN